MTINISFHVVCKDEIRPRYITSQFHRVNTGSFPTIFYVLPLEADKRCQVTEQLSRSSLIGAFLWFHSTSLF